MSRLLSCMDSLYLEVFPDAKIHEQLLSLPAGSHVGLTCSPKKGLQTTLDLMTQLHGSGLELIPHVAARQVRDKAHLQDVLDQLHEQGVETLFVPGGDMAKPVGSYASALALLRDVAELGHSLRDIGIAAHPEGHPEASNEALQQALLDKQPLATYMVTQMCFNVPLMIDWLKGMRAAGVSLPVWFGLPGVMDRLKLFKTALRIGVGESARFARKQKSLTGALLGASRYTPDDILMDVAPALEDEALGIGGFYLFSFNQLEETLAWRTQLLQDLKAKTA